MLTSAQYVRKQADKFTSKQQWGEWWNCRKNPFYFIFNYVHIPEIGGMMKYEEHRMHPKIKQTVRSITRFHRALLMATRQLGKALSINTPIPLASGGYKKMGDLQVGDWILDGTGNPTQVIATTEIMNDRPCYRITFDNNEVLDADENHLWKISNTSDRIVDKILTTKEIYQIEQKLKNWTNSTSCKIKLPDNINYSDNILPIHPYIVGLWLGDGAKDTNQMSCFEDDYIEYKKLLNERGYEISDFICRQGPTNESGRFTIYDIRPIMREIGILGNKFIPDEYLYTSIENRLELLRGLMDSDGCQMKNCNSNQFYQKDFNLFSQVRQLLNSLGIKSKYRNRIIKGEVYHQLTFTTNKYRVFNLARKQRSCKPYRDETKWVYIKSIEPIDSIPVRCIQVANPDGMFLCGESMLPTHNSTISAALLEWACNFYPRMPATILNANKTFALENLEKVKFIHSELPSFLRNPLKFRGERKTTIDYTNDSILRVFYPSSSTSPSTLARSLTSPILYIDEAAHIKHMRQALRLAPSHSNMC